MTEAVAEPAESIANLELMIGVEFRSARRTPAVHAHFHRARIGATPDQARADSVHRPWPVRGPG